MRVYNAIHPSYIFENRSYLERWRGEPGEFAFGIHLNSGGFLDVEIPPRRADTFRIIALGDSFAFGVVPYVDNYLTLLEERLGDFGKYEVLNMGIPGTGPANHLELLESEGLALDPDMVLLSLFLGNDLTDGLSEDRLDELLGEESLFETWHRNFQASYLWKALHYLLVIVPRLPDQETVASPTEADQEWEYCEDCTSAADWSTFLMIEGYTAEQFFTNVPSTAENVDRVLDTLNTIRNVCEERGIELVVVLIPDALQIDDELGEILIVREYEHMREFYDPYYPNRLLVGELDELSIPYLDLYDALRNGQRGGRVYIERNTHWNIRGNAIAADAIMEYLLESGNP